MKIKLLLASEESFERQAHSKSALMPANEEGGRLLTAIDKRDDLFQLAPWSIEIEPEKNQRARKQQRDCQEPPDHQLSRKR